MPVAIRVSNRSKDLSSRFLMPLAFASILGGLTTLIGAPPNIIISKFRQQESGEPFHMFDITSVGLEIAVAGIVFIALVGVRFVFDGGCHRSVVGLSHSGWPTVKHDSDGAGRLSVWRLFQVGVPAGNRDRHRLDSANHVVLAAGDIGRMTGGGA